MRRLFTLSLIPCVALIVSCGKGGSSSPKSHVVSSPQVLSTEIDREVKKLMDQTGATAVTVAVAKNGEIEYEQSYGFKDAQMTIALESNALMRTASVVKPITAAAIRKLDASGMLALSDHVFCVENNEPCWLSTNLLSTTTDSRAQDITIQQLIAHQGGWYRDVSNDPFEEEVAIRDSLNLSGPPTREDIIRYVMARPLDYTPGAPDYVSDNYSNLGYLLLGMIIEQSTSTTYTEYVQTEIMADLGVSSDDFKSGASKLIEHDAREPNYISTDLCPSVFDVNKTALCSEEGADGRNWVAVGASIATARAMALFAQHYQLPQNYTDGYGVVGEPLASLPSTGSHDGDLPGLTSLVRQLPSGVSYAIFLNVSFNLAPSISVLDRLSQLAPYQI